MLAFKTLLMLHGLPTPGEARGPAKSTVETIICPRKHQMHTYRGYAPILSSSLQFSECSPHALKPGLFFHNHTLG